MRTVFGHETLFKLLVLYLMHFYPSFHIITVAEDDIATDDLSESGANEVSYVAQDHDHEG